MVGPNRISSSSEVLEMKFTRFAFAALALACVSSTAALADTFSFNFGTAGVSAFNGSGTLTGTLTAPGQFLITSVTGTTNTGNGTNRVISGIDGLNTFEGNDNILYMTTGSFFFDDGGLSYSLANGAMVNLFLGSGEILERTSGATVSQSAPISVTAVTPEPGTLLLMGTGMLGTLGVLRRRVTA